mmetsp:Transcript_27748/g.51632  ORF Transcript_27748/g.51632 Transcript_27748/m.51632 type:complete len:219 (+) Transcript_27748:705-1361(+)
MQGRTTQPPRLSQVRILRRRRVDQRDQGGRARLLHIQRLPKSRRTVLRRERLQVRQDEFGELVPGGRMYFRGQGQRVLSVGPRRPGNVLVPTVPTDVRVLSDAVRGEEPRVFCQGGERRADDLREDDRRWGGRILPERRTRRLLGVGLPLSLVPLGVKLHIADSRRRTVEHGTMRRRGHIVRHGENTGLREGSEVRRSESGAGREGKLGAGEGRGDVS